MAVHVDAVAQEVERVERNAKRQDQVQDSDDGPEPEPRAEIVERRGEQIVLLENAEHDHISERQSEAKASPDERATRHESARREAERGHADQEREKTAVGPAVEHHARSKQPPAARASWDEPVPGHDDRQKAKKE